MLEITEVDIRNYFIKCDRVGGVIQNTPYATLEMLVNGDLDLEEFKQELLDNRTTS